MQGNVYTVTQDVELSSGSMRIRLYADNPHASSNDSGICILFQTENCAILITGDLSVSGERALLARAQLPQLTILVAGHHGARTSTGTELLEATRPEYVVISVGKNNTFGHPNPDTLARIEEFGCKILRTDLVGTILIRG